MNRCNNTQIKRKTNPEKQQFLIVPLTIALEHFLETVQNRLHHLLFIKHTNSKYGSHQITIKRQLTGITKQHQARSISIIKQTRYKSTVNIGTLNSNSLMTTALYNLFITYLITSYKPQPGHKNKQP